MLNVKPDNQKKKNYLLMSNTMEQEFQTVPQWLETEKSYA